MSLTEAQLDEAFDLARSLRHTDRFVTRWRHCHEFHPDPAQLGQGARAVRRRWREPGMVASDRVSAFDVIMAEPIADKGRVCTAMSVFWYDELADVAPGSLLAADPDEIQAALPGQSLPGDWAGRALLVRRAEMLPIECIVRGYLAGQAHQEYERSGPCTAR